MIIHQPMWHIAFTGRFVEDFEGHYEALIPYYMRDTYYDWDRDIYHWHHKWLAPFVRAWHRSSKLRWLPVRILRAFLHDRDHI